jgi:murein DD-endopeptidase MepM/ murein hydrolase activator NlpD
MKFIRGKKLILITSIIVLVIGSACWVSQHGRGPLVPPQSENVISVVEEPSPVQVHSQKHIVAEGETLSSIAENYHIDVATIEYANNLTTETVVVGQELTILPQKGVIHQVNDGDTLWSIAKQYQVTLEALRIANDIQADHITVGDNILIPGGRPRGETAISRGRENRFIWPTTGEISSPFGYRWGRLHAGIDIANDEGTAVKAVRNGKVIFVGWCGGYGNAVMIDHGQEVVSLYGHLSKYYVQVGQVVQRGQRVAAMGTTGDSTGPHLHFEVRQYGKPVNPLNLLPDR